MIRVPHHVRFSKLYVRRISHESGTGGSTLTHLSGLKKANCKQLFEIVQMH